MKVEVISDAAKLNGEYLKPGSIVDLESDLAQRWINFGLARSISLSDINKETGSNKEIDKGEGWPRHLGAGWYLLPNGEKVQGKDKAIKAMAELLEQAKKEEAAKQADKKDNEPEEDDNKTALEEKPEGAGDIDDTETDNETEE